MKSKIEKFKISLRREQIQKQFQSRRSKLTVVDDTCYQTFRVTTEKIQSSITQGNLSQSLGCLKKLIEIIKVNSEASTFVFMQSSNMSQIIQLASNDKIENQKQKQILDSPEMNNKIIQNLLEFLSIINYNILDCKSFAEVFRSFWKILQNKQIDQKHLEKSLLILNKMMNPPNQIVYSCLKEYKLSARIMQLLKMQEVIQIKSKIKYQILETISLLLYNQRLFQQQPDTNSKQNKAFLIFCLKQLKHLYSQYLKSQVQSNTIEEVVQINLMAIRNLLSFDAVLVNRVTSQDLGIQCKLMDSNVRKIQVYAAQIVNIVVLQNSSFSDFLVGNLQLVQLIDKQLRKQLYLSDDETKNLVQKYVCLLCNIINVKDNKLKMKLYQQHVWDLAPVYIRKFNSFINVFSFYFQIVPEDQLLNKIMCYLDAIAQLDKKLLQRNYNYAIEMTIHRLYYRLDSQLPQSAMQKFIEKFNHNQNLRQFLNEEMKDNIDMREDTLC